MRLYMIKIILCLQEARSYKDRLVGTVTSFVDYIEQSVSFDFYFINMKHETTLVICKYLVPRYITGHTEYFFEHP